ncbi:MAG: hypothetical protein C5B49_15285 [Bdellovibrio sp.]|nr:MAG: hypothetical protein C5B49_15285 [Bdellovibrio sp.]
MHYFYGTLIQLKPYLVSLDEFKDPKNKEYLTALLTDFEKKILEQEPPEIEKAEGFNVTYLLMARHLREVKHLYDAAVYEPAWQKLNATTNFCMACHTRLFKPSLGSGATGLIEARPFEGLKQESSGISAGSAKDLRDAEFYFISHNYLAALQIYDAVIRQFKPPAAGSSTVGVAVEDLQKIYERKLAYFARVKRDPEGAISSLKDDRKNQNLPPRIRENIQTWIDKFADWKKKAASDYARVSDEELLKLVKTTGYQELTGQPISGGDPYVIDLLWVSGVLYERVFRTPNSSAIPEMLYWLAKIERDLGSIHIYSLADVYLRECVINFPKSPIARQCLNEYELGMKQKMGPSSPEYINSSINLMRKTIEEANKPASHEN